MNQNRYMDIKRLKPTFSDGFEKGDNIVVQEKIDGANFSIRYDESDNSIKAFSRKTKLDYNNNLRGAWEWSQKLDVELVKKVLGNNLILFMEWLVPHSVPYPNEIYHNAFCYDIYNTNTEEYLPQNMVEEKVNKLGLIYVPVFYKGDFISWKHIENFVGKTELGGEYGEGVVVKNQTKLNNPNTRMPFYTKIVCERFCETKAYKISKPVDANKLAKRERILTLVESVVTVARVQKILHKLVDENIIPEDWSAKDMKTIAQNLSHEVYYDCLKEEFNIVEEVGESFGKFASSTAMKIVRDILNNK